MGGHGTGERVRRSTVHNSVAEPQKKNKVSASAAWREARQLVWAHRRRLTIGLALMLVSRVSQLVLPFTPKWIVDEVLGKGRTDLLVPIALAGAAATHNRADAATAAARNLPLIDPPTGRTG